MLIKKCVHDFAFSLVPSKIWYAPQKLFCWYNCLDLMWKSFFPCNNQIVDAWFLNLESTFLKILSHSKKVHASSQVIIIFWDVFEACSFYVIFMPLNSHVSVRTLHRVLRWPELWSFERKTYVHIISYLSKFISTHSVSA